MKAASWHCSRHAQVVRIQSPRALSTNNKTAQRKRKQFLHEDHHRNDIVPGDLTATLEAHRRTNRDPIHRYFVRIPGESAASEPVKVEQPPSVLNTVPLQVDKVLPFKDDVVTTFRYYTPRGNQQELRSAAEPGASQDVGTTAGNVDADTRKSRTEALLGKEKDSRGRRKRGDAEIYGKGRYVEIPRTSDLREPLRPWIISDPALQRDRDRLLSAQMAKLADWLSLTPAEHAFRDQLALDLCRGMQKQLEDVDFWFFGSGQTGLATVLSDIDIGFYVPSMQKAPGERGPSASLSRRQNRAKINKVLISIYISSIWAKRFDTLERVQAKYPLVRGTHVGSSVDIQVVAYQPTRVVNEYVRDCIAEYQQLKPIYLLLKTALDARKLSDPYSGGVGSYTLLNMIVVALKAEQVSRRDSLATAFHKVLTFIEKLDTRRIGLTNAYPYTFSKLAPNETICAKEKQDAASDTVLWARHQIGVKNEKQDFLLCLQDPNDPFNDLGRAAYRILDVQKTFGKIKESLDSWLKNDEAVSVHQVGRISGPNQLLDWMLGNMCNLVQDRREVFERWSATSSGKYELEQMAKRLKEAEERRAIASSSQGDRPKLLTEQTKSQGLEKALDELM